MCHCARAHTRRPNVKMSSAEVGFDCEFIQKPPIRSSCPICLLILREPYQVTCCGKIFCRDCIQRITIKKKPCPTCNEKEFENYPDKGLKQELYSCKVFCSYKEKACEWQGELGQLDKHLNANPDQDEQFEGCEYMNIKCLHCTKEDQRQTIKCHQTSECWQRPFSCEMCKEFKSTYDDLTKNHAPSCKCRLVECPNGCGKVLQHQKLESHLSSACPLLMVECEFSDAGCDAKVKRTDLMSHMSENIIAHMSLLARENRRLKSELQEQATLFKSELEKQANLFVSRQKELLTVVPLEIVYPDYAKHKKNLTEWSSKPFYTHAGGYKLNITMKHSFKGLGLNFNVLENEFEALSSCRISISVLIVDRATQKKHITETCLKEIGSPTIGSSLFDVPQTTARMVIEAAKVAARGFTGAKSELYFGHERISFNHTMGDNCLLIRIPEVKILSK